MTKPLIKCAAAAVAALTLTAMGALAVTFDVPAQPLGENANAAVAAAAFYLGHLAVALVLMAIATSLRQGVWALYTLLVLLGLAYIALFEQNITGIVWSGLDVGARGLVFAGYAMLSVNYLVAAHTIPTTHAYARLKTPFRIAAAAIWGLWALGTTGTLEFAHLLFSIAGCTVAIAHFFPVSTFSKLRGGYDTLIRNAIWVLLFAVLIGGVIVIATAYEGQSLTVTINRILIAGITVAFGALFIRNIFVLQSDRELAVQEALDRAVEQARTAQELLDAQESHRAAVAIARDRNLRLATASHDIRQPISSLRTSFAALTRDMPDETRQHLHHSLDYLDELASSYVTEASEAETGPALAEQERMETDDPAVRADQIAETLHRMFTDDAAERGLTLTTDVTPAALQTQPLALMRVLCNVVSNAIAHGAPGTLHLHGVQAPDGYTFHIRNPGAATLDFTAWEKGEGSTGSGLGLAIVQEQAARAGLLLTTEHSGPDETCISITIPNEAPQ